MTWADGRDVMLLVRISGLDLTSGQARQFGTFVVNSIRIQKHYLDSVGTTIDSNPLMRTGMRLSLAPLTIYKSAMLRDSMHTPSYRLHASLHL